MNEFLDDVTGWAAEVDKSLRRIADALETLVEHIIDDDLAETRSLRGRLVVVESVEKDEL